MFVKEDILSSYFLSFFFLLLSEKTNRSMIKAMLFSLAINYALKHNRTSCNFNRVENRIWKIKLIIIIIVMIIRCYCCYCCSSLCSDDERTSMTTDRWKDIDVHRCFA